MARFFDVVLNVPMNQTFTYLEKTDYTLQKDESASEPDLFAKKKRAVKKTELHSEKLSNEELFGWRVEIRFGSRQTYGFIVDVKEELPKNFPLSASKIRPVEKLIDDEPILTHELYDLAKWISKYYIASIGESVFTMIPSGKKESGTPGFSFSEDESVFEKKDLSDEQKNAVKGILTKQGSSDFHYLYGMTGSGKTEVFLTAADRVLAEGKGVIYLVPEIGLTPQVVQAVVKRFGNTAAVLHSELTPNQKLTEWKRILHKEARVVIGARSAVFAPVPDLGLVIIDEEHDSSYKSGSSPRYHARQVAMFRTSRLHIPLVKIGRAHV